MVNVYYFSMTDRIALYVWNQTAWVQFSQAAVALSK